ncbi:hypothetical protein SX4_3204 [Vibrio mimicus SX-4]|nr:hypothetical protein SX4_3204 [Vibrio mimicus SX-4]ERM54484.1 hypothetical protein P780_13545 [Vibrio mimicus CAIM 1882]ERM54576.1 hypothetical protein P781_13570 [Vibrio mimicus CAIM 1883]
MVLVSWCLIFNALMHQKDPSLHYFGASPCCSAPCFTKTFAISRSIAEVVNDSGG